MAKIKSKEFALIVEACPDTEPNTLKEALSRDDGHLWAEAIRSETQSLEDRQTWRVATEEEIAANEPIPHVGCLSINMIVLGRSIDIRPVWLLVATSKRKVLSTPRLLHQQSDLRVW